MHLSQIVRAIKAPWVDDELKALMSQRADAKDVASRSGCMSDWQIYQKHWNYVTKLNKRRKNVE